MRRLTPFAIIAALFLVPPAASAQDEPPIDEVPPPVQPKPDPRPGNMSLSVESGLAHKGKRYVAQGQIVKVEGRSRPYVSGQRARVVVRRGGKTVVDRRVKLRRKDGGKAGGFAIRFRARGVGAYKVTARHAATARQEAFSAAARTRSVKSRAGYGSGGLRVLLLQKGLKRLAYAGIKKNGSFDSATARAVLAFRKVNRLGRRMYASRGVFKRVFRGKGTFELRYPKAGKHVEADLSRQVLVLAKGGKARRIYHTSSGKASTPTVLGTYRFYRKQPGTNGSGMVHSAYFLRGYAIHGYRSVPTYPASHGCLRVPIANAWAIYRWVDIGDRISVYR